MAAINPAEIPPPLKATSQRPIKTDLEPFNDSAWKLFQLRRWGQLKFNGLNADKGEADLRPFSDTTSNGIATRSSENSVHNG